MFCFQNVGIPSKSFNSFKEKSFSSLLTESLSNHEFPGSKCNILHNTPVSISWESLDINALFCYLVNNVFISVAYI